MRMLALLLPILCLGGRARADEPPAKLEAKRLSDLGAEALTRGEYAIALQHFEESHRTFASPRLLYNIGLALDGLGRKPETIDAFESFLRDAPDTPEDTRAWARRRIEELEPECAHITVAVEPPGAEATIDGQRRAQARVAPGPHEIRATLVGYLVAAQSVTVAPGESKRVALQLVAIAVPAPAPPPPPPKRSVFRRWWFWTVVGGAVAAGTLTALAASSRDELPSSSLGVTKPMF